MVELHAFIYCCRRSNFSLIAHPVVRNVDCEHGPTCSDCSEQKARTEYAIQLCWPDEDAGTPPDVRESWFDIVPTSSVNFGTLSPLCVAFIMFHCFYMLILESVQRMIGMTTELYRSRWMKRDPIDYWVDETNRIVLIGEAAHPWFVSVFNHHGLCCNR